MFSCCRSSKVEPPVQEIPVHKSTYNNNHTSVQFIFPKVIIVRHKQNDRCESRIKHEPNIVKNKDLDITNLKIQTMTDKLKRKIEADDVSIAQGYIERSPPYRVRAQRSYRTHG